MGQVKVKSVAEVRDFETARAFVLSHESTIDRTDLHMVYLMLSDEDGDRIHALVVERGLRVVGDIGDAI